MKNLRIALWALTVVAGVGCSSKSPGTNDGTGDGGSKIDYSAHGTLLSIQLTPANQEITVTDSNPVHVTYSAQGSFSDGWSGDVTSIVTFRLDKTSLGSFDGNILSSSSVFGGVTQVIAENGVVQGLGTLQINVTRTVGSTDAGSISELAQHFLGTNDPSRAPDLVYPNDGVLLPPNLGKLEFHWKTQGGTDLYELTFQSDMAQVKVYAGCTVLGAGCFYLPDANVWQAIAETNRGGSPVQVSLRATSTGGGGVGSSAPISISFSQDDILGGVYYWTTTTKSIMRYDFAGTDTAASLFANGQLLTGSASRCMGCHALSRDGYKMTVEADGSNGGDLAVVDVSTGGPLDGGSVFPVPTQAIFASWSPDSAHFVGVHSSYQGLRIANGTTSVMEMDVPGTGDDTNPPDHPDWSADGNTIAYTRIGQKQGTTGSAATQRQWLYNGSIHMVQKSGASWGSSTEIVPQAAGINRYYPAIAPNNQFLVYDESTCPGGTNGTDCNADTDPTATLWAAKLQTGAQRINLAKANAKGKTDATTALTNSFPKWSPFTFNRTGEFGSKLMWITFATQRNYGLRSTISTSSGEGHGKGSWVWMAAIDPDKIDQGLDPSYPAFFLPCQDIATSNHIGQWTTKVIKTIRPN